jgi:hypothetical protein
LVGAKGDTGEKGADGDDAYEVWLAAGHVGSRDDFLASLVGAKGDTGAIGPQGPQGEKGDAGNTLPTVAALLTNATAISLLVNTSNWNVDGVYIGTAITLTYAGQFYYNTEYYFIAVDDNVWRRLIFG